MMVRQLLAALGSTVALVGAIVAVAVIGTGIVVFDRWPAVGGAGPNGNAPLALATGGDGRTASARARVDRDRRSAQPAAGDDRPSAGSGTGHASRPGASGSSPSDATRVTTGRSPGAGERRPPTRAPEDDPIDTGPAERIAGAVASAGVSAGQGTRAGGTAAGATVGAVHAPTGDYTATSADAAATRMQKAAEIVAEALRRLQTH